MAKNKSIDVKSVYKFSPVKMVVKLIFVVIWIVSLIYLLNPSLVFPKPPSDSFQSTEPADSEDPMRRAYFTNFTREEVIKHYEDQMKHPSFSFMRQRLNYPPEDAQVLIRDQTRSTFLEEINYPMRESLYINGFEPKDAKDDIWYKGEHYRQKITIKYVPNDTGARIIVSVGILITSLWLIHELFKGA